MIEPGARLAALRGDLGLARLAGALSLADRFGLYLIACPDPATAAGAFDVLRERVSAAREAPVRLRVLAPPLLGEVSADELIEGLLATLTQPMAGDRDAEIVVIDASSARSKDEEAWAVLFQRLNERRNAVSRAINGPLLIALTRDLERVLARAAPDLWSIRSLAVAVVAKTPPTPVEPALLPDEARTAAAELVQAEEALARTRGAGLTGESVELAALVSALVALGDAADAAGDLARAQAAYEEGLSVSRALVKRDPERVEWLRDLSVSLNKVGDVMVSRGDLGGAQAAYEEGLSVRRALVKRDPERVEWLRDLSVSLNKVGDVMVSRGDLGGAQAAYEEGLSVSRALLKRDPERMEWLRDLSVSLDRRAGLAENGGRLEAALPDRVQALEIARRLAKVHVDQPGFAFDLALSNIDLARLLERMNRPQEAGQHWAQGLAALQPLVDSPAPAPKWRDAEASCRAALERLGPPTGIRPEATPPRSTSDRGSNNSE